MTRSGMKKNNRKKAHIICITIFIFVVLVIGIQASYAYYHQSDRFNRVVDIFLESEENK